MMASGEEKLEKQRFWRANGHHVVLDSNGVGCVDLVDVKEFKVVPCSDPACCKRAYNTRPHPPACPLMCISSAHLSLALYGSESEFIFNFPLAVA